MTQEYRASRLEDFVESAIEQTWEDVAKGAHITLEDGSVWARVSPGGADCDRRYRALIDRHDESARDAFPDAFPLDGPFHDLFVNVTVFTPERIYCSACGWFRGHLFRVAT
jgi:hypothetical protein